MQSTMCPRCASRRMSSMFTIKSIESFFRVPGMYVGKKWNVLGGLVSKLIRIDVLQLEGAWVDCEQ